MANYDSDIQLTVDLEPGDIQSTAQSLKKELEEVVRINVGKNISKSSRSLFNSIDQTTLRATELLNKMKQLETAKIPTEQYKSLNSEFDKLNNSWNKMTKLREEADKIQQQLDTLRTEKIPTAEYVALGKEYESLAKKLTTLNERKEKFLDTGGRTNSKTFKRLEYDIDIVERKLVDVLQAQDALQKNGEAFTLGNTSKEFTTLEEKYNKLTGQIQEYTDRYREALRLSDELAENGKEFTLGSDTPEYDKLSDQLSGVNNRMFMLRQRVIDLADAQDSESVSIDRAGSNLHRFGSTAVSVSKKIGTISNFLLTGGVGFKRLNSIIESLITNFTKLASTAIRRGISKLASSFSKLGKNTDVVNRGLKIGFKQLLRYGLGVRSVFFLIKRLRKALIEGFGNLSQYSEPFNETLSKFVTML